MIFHHHHRCCDLRLEAPHHNDIIQLLYNFFYYFSQRLCDTLFHWCAFSAIVVDEARRDAINRFHPPPITIFNPSAISILYSGTQRERCTRLFNHFNNLYAILLIFPSFAIALFLYARQIAIKIGNDFGDNHCRGERIVMCDARDESVVNDDRR